MRLREREMPLDPEVERELEAIDRALAGEPVDPDLEPLAELARALSEERVDTEPGFAADLDQRVADGFPRPGQLAGSHRLAELRKKLTAVPPRRILARAGAAATVLVVAGVTISQSGEIWGGGDGSFNTRPAPDQPVGVAADQPNAAAEGAGGAADGRDAGPTARFEQRRKPNRPPGAGLRAACRAVQRGIRRARQRRRRPPLPAQGRPPRRPGAVDLAGALPDRGRRRPRRGPRPPRLRSSLERLRGRSRHATVTARPCELHPSDPRRGAVRRPGRPLRPGPCRLANRRASGHHEPVRVRPEADRRARGDAPEPAAPARRGGDADRAGEHQAAPRDRPGAALGGRGGPRRRPAARAAGARQRHDRRRPRPRRRRRRRRRGASATPSTTRARSCR